MQQRTPGKLIPLDTVQPGQQVRVSQLDSRAGLRGRLYAMGLTPGTTVKLVADGGGPLVLSILGSRVMIGRGMAEKILVRKGLET